MIVSLSGSPRVNISNFDGFSKLQGHGSGHFADCGRSCLVRLARRSACSGPREYTHRHGRRSDGHKIESVSVLELPPLLRVFFFFGWGGAKRKTGKPPYWQGTLKEKTHPEQARPSANASPLRPRRCRRLAEADGPRPTERTRSLGLPSGRKPYERKPYGL